jgi:hypothetical protein
MNGTYAGKQPSHFRSWALVVATAIARAESTNYSDAVGNNIWMKNSDGSYQFDSNGNHIVKPHATNKTLLPVGSTWTFPDGSFGTVASHDRGLWQINDAVHGDVDDSQAFDPNGCAVAAYAISSKGTTFGPWASFYTPGKYGKVDFQGKSDAAYYQFLTGARKEAAKIEGSGVITAVPGTVVQCTTDNVSVHVSAGSSDTNGTIGTGATGTLTGNTTFLQKNNLGRWYNWWEVDWGNNLKGWVVEDYLFGSKPGGAVIKSALPLTVGVAQGSTFTITYSINAPSLRTVILGASLYPAGQDTGRIDDPTHDAKISLSIGDSQPQRQFTVPASLTIGAYDLVVALWDDTNNNGQVDPADHQITFYKVISAVSVMSSGSGCTYSLTPTKLDLQASGAASSKFTVSTSSACNWTAVPNQNWISITKNNSGSGSLDVNFGVSANTDSTARSGTITVQNQIFTITQPGAGSPSGGHQNVTVSNILHSPPDNFPGRALTFYADVNSPITQSVLLGATIIPSGTSVSYFDPANDKAATVFGGQTQYNRMFTIPVDAPPGIYDVVFGVWADNNGNGQIDNTTDTLLGSFTSYGALTVKPPLGTIYVTMAPQGALDAGAQWRCDGGNWLGSGSLNFQVAVGNHTIGFMPVAGYAKPADQIVSVQTNQTSNIIGVYTPLALGNISTRLSVGTNDNVLIGGIIVAGTEPKKMMVRAVGPSLAQSGVSNVLNDPMLELYDSNGTLIASNDDWQSTQLGGIIGTNQVGEIQNSGLAPTQPSESAILATLNPGAFTAIVRGKSNTSGVASVESYDLNRTVDANFANISTRGLVQAADNVMIGGLIVLGQTAQKVIVRAIGPSLTQYGISDALLDPTLELHDPNGALIATNDNWQSTQIGGIITTDQVSDIQNSGLAPTQPTESAIIAVLNPGGYTAIVRGKNSTTGVALVEGYQLKN